MYVGSTQCVRSRWYHHRYALRHGRHANPRLQRAWTKYGEAAFTFSVLARPVIAHLLAVEQSFLDYYTHLAGTSVYNAHRYAGTARGYAHSDETKSKIGQSKRGRPMPPHVRDALITANTGRSVPDEVRQRIAAKLHGRTPSQETRRKLSERNKGQKPSALAIERSREYNRTHTQSPESRLKRSIALRGKPQLPRGPLSEETRVKIGDALRDRKKSPETLVRMRAAKASTKRAIEGLDPHTECVVVSFAGIVDAVHAGYCRNGIYHSLRKGCVRGGFRWRYTQET